MAPWMQCLVPPSQSHICESTVASSCFPEVFFEWFARDVLEIRNLQDLLSPSYRKESPKTIPHKNFRLKTSRKGGCRWGVDELPELRKETFMLGRSIANRFSFSVKGCGFLSAVQYALGRFGPDTFKPQLAWKTRRKLRSSVRPCVGPFCSKTGRVHLCKKKSVKMHTKRFCSVLCQLWQGDPFVSLTSCGNQKFRDISKSVLSEPAMKSSVWLKTWSKVLLLFSLKASLQIHWNHSVWLGVAVSPERRKNTSRKLSLCLSFSPFCRLVMARLCQAWSAPMAGWSEHSLPYWFRMPFAQVFAFFFACFEWILEMIGYKVGQKAWVRGWPFPLQNIQWFTLKCCSKRQAWASNLL